MVGIINFLKICYKGACSWLSNSGNGCTKGICSFLKFRKPPVTMMGIRWMTSFSRQPWAMLTLVGLSQIFISVPTTICSHVRVTVSKNYSTSQQVIDSDDSWGIKCNSDGPEVWHRTTHGVVRGGSVDIV